MTRLLAAAVLALALSTPAGAQRVEDSSARWFAAPPAEMRTPPAPRAVPTEALAADAARKDRRRNMFVGGVAGAAIGAIAGTYVMIQSDEWMGAPAHFLTVPVGAVVGVLIGALL